MKVAVIGQSQFGEEVYKLLRKDGHEVVGVFTIPDVNGKPDPLGKNSLQFCQILSHFENGCEPCEVIMHQCMPAF